GQPAARPPAAGPRRWDLVVTVLLVAFGTLTTIDGMAGWLDLPATLSQLYTALGYDGAVEPVALAGRVGVALAILNPALLVIGIVVSSLRLRGGRLGFVWPLGTGIVAAFVSMVLLAIVLSADPGFLGFLGTPSTIPSVSPSG
ncbi:MAG: DUF6264 family protein, partial [Microbacteriaceae bacterium]